MHSDHDDLEVNDYDKDVRRREALIKEAKGIETSSDWSIVLHETSDLKRRWRRVSYWDSAYKEMLNEKFDSCMNVFYAKRREEYQSNQAIRQGLIDRTEKIAASDNWDQVTEEINELT